LIHSWAAKMFLDMPRRLPRTQYTTLRQRDTSLGVCEIVLAPGLASIFLARKNKYNGSMSACHGFYLRQLLSGTGSVTDL
jgi:hypothetical protein